MDVPTPEGREQLKTAFFDCEMEAGQEPRLPHLLSKVRSCEVVV